MKLSLDQIKKILVRAIYAAAKNAFVFMLLLIVVAFLIVIPFFYFSVYSVHQKPIEERPGVEFQSATLERIIQKWTEREEQFNTAGTSLPRNIFIPQETGLTPT